MKKEIIEALTPLAFIISVAAIIFFLFAIANNIGNKDPRSDWTTFATEHHCIVVSRHFDHTGEIGYYCDDGVVYYR